MLKFGEHLNSSDLQFKSVAQQQYTHYDLLSITSPVMAQL